MKILKWWKNASAKKSKTEKLSHALRELYTPIVVLLAVLVAVLSRRWRGLGNSPVVWQSVGILSCFLSLCIGIVVPLTHFAIGAASKCGILVKGGGDLDTLSRLKTVVFDKTGTLTKGRFSVTRGEGRCAEAGGNRGGNEQSPPLRRQSYRHTKGELPAAQSYQELGGYGISTSWTAKRFCWGTAV